MDTLDALRTRRSIRHYKVQDVEAELIQEILAAGMCAPLRGQ
jgi:nitroreductase